ncbi:MAG: hypothetical protein QNJ46_07465 [Leptolyngbyaceae cyanobacterium MO_188.B28]|nr:hypothetical protein [Leptolyngbyaceae cyanobacterium MO_188.B28]
MSLISILLSTSTQSKRTATHLSEKLSIALLASIPAVILAIPAIAAPSAAIVESIPQASDLPLNQVAQAARRDVLFFETSSYAVRVFRQNNQLFMNAYHKDSNVTEQNSAFATLDSTNEGQTAYVSFGDNYIRNNQRQSVGYRAIINTQGNAELRIISQAGSTLLREDGYNITVSEPPPSTPGAPTAIQDTVLLFATDTYRTRVFRQGEQLLMNINNNQSGVNELSAGSTTITPPRNQNDTWTSYTSARRDPSRGLLNYYARISPSGVAELEIIDSSGRILLREIAQSAEINNSPSQLVQGANQPYVVAVPRGNEGTLAEVRKYYPEAYLDSSRQGRFVNAGSFTDRNFAEARASVLRANGLDARVVYRSVRFYY